MQIADDFEFEDRVTGLKFKVRIGPKLNRLEIRNIKGGQCNNRDLWFTKTGQFDGTGSSMQDFVEAKGKITTKASMKG